jgi:Flp pilus assembly protein TadD
MRAVACLDGDGTSEPSDVERAKQQTLAAACYLNLAGLTGPRLMRVREAVELTPRRIIATACQLKRSQYSEAAESCRRVLANDVNNVKARFRLGKALAGKGDLEEAKRELEKVRVVHRALAAEAAVWPDSLWPRG